MLSLRSQKSISHSSNNFGELLKFLLTLMGRSDKLTFRRVFSHLNGDDEVDDDVVHDTAEERQPEDSIAGIEISTAPINDNTTSESLSTAGKEIRKYKRKAIMTEPEPENKSKKLLEQVRLGLEEAIRLQEQVDEEERAQIARQLLALDDKRTTSEPKTTKDIDLNDPSVQNYSDLKNKPKLEAQARKNMIVYLKNQSNYKMKDFEGMSYDEIRPIFEKVCDFNHNFVPIDLEIEKEKKKPAEFQEIEEEQEVLFYTSAGNPVKEILLKLNIPDHRILKDGGEDFRYSDTVCPSQSDKVLKLKNIKKDASLKMFKLTNQERYEHIYFKNQPEEPPFTDYMKAICNLDVPVDSKAPKYSSPTKEAPQGKEPGKETKSSSAMDTSPSHPSPPTPMVGEMHKEAHQAAGGPTSLGATNKSKSGGDGLKTTHTTSGANEESRAHDISQKVKLEDLSNILKDTRCAFFTSDSLTDEPIISQKEELEKAKLKAEAKVVSMKTKPLYADINQLTELLLLPTELKELPSKITGLSREIKELKQHIKDMEIKLPRDLIEIPTKLESFTSTISNLSS
ncbi:hypothetical protein Tco_0357611 [Tanacetum coccineum]